MIANPGDTHMLLDNEEELEITEKVVSFPLQ